MRPSSREQPRENSRAGSVLAVRLDETHEAAMARFFQRAWSAPAPAIDPAAPAFGLLVDGELAGYLGTIPVRFWDGAREHPGHWMKGFMVLPEFRNGSVGFLVLKEAARQLGMAASLSVAPAARRLFAAAGFRELGTLSNQITLLRPWRVFRVIDPAALGLPLPPMLLAAARGIQHSGVATAAGWLLGALLGAWRFVTRLDPRPLAIGGAPRPADVDRLWRRLRYIITSGVVRDARHFARYGKGYRIVSIYKARVLQGMAVVRAPRSDGDPRLRGIRVAVTAELLAHPADHRVLRALLRASERAAVEMGADALLCSASHAPLQRLLRNQAYLSFPGNVRMLLRAAPGIAERPLSDWWLTRGDGHADEIF